MVDQEFNLVMSILLFIFEASINQNTNAMGQRHQIFVRILNPVNYLRFESVAEKKKAVSELGTSKYTILAYYNQWLYGRSAIVNAMRLLEFGSQFETSHKDGTEKYGSYKCPFTTGGYNDGFNSIEKITTAIGFIMNYQATNNSFVNAGIGSSWYLNDTNPEIRNNFTIEDNNDGITIIDLVENKYCFMNIYKQEMDSYDVKDLPYLKPVDAKAYITAYYGETIETVNPYYLGNHDRSLITISRDEQQAIVDKIISDNKLCLEGFDKFGVLTQSEIKKLFPKFKLTKIESR